MTFESAVDCDALTAAKFLLGDCRAVAPCRGGRNSRVYRVTTADGIYALKLYPDDGRERALREFAATTFFAQSGIARVPRPIAIDPSQRAAVYSWLDGEAIGEVTSDDIDLLVQFAAELHSLRSCSAAASIRDAAEACFDATSVFDQIQMRFERLTDVGDQPLLHEFLQAEFTPVFAIASSRTRAMRTGRRGRIVRTLSPSDFGFHNALRLGSSDIAFLDFEYFGWDDPVKVVADMCWHPGMALRRELRDRLVTRCSDIYEDDGSFMECLEGSYALYGLRWCLIVLNEFLPVYRRRRAAAAGSSKSTDLLLFNQLAKAVALLVRVRKCLSVL